VSRLIFLGTGAGGSRGSSRHKPAIYLDGLLFDCGAGTAERLEDTGLIEAVRCVFLTHLHSDHISGVYDLLVAMVVGRRGRPLSLYAPPGIERLLAEYAALGNKLTDPAAGFELSVHNPLVETCSEGDVTVSGFEMRHVITDVGYFVRTPSFSLFYTGDTSQPVNFKMEADYLVHEATFTERYREFARATGHSTGRQAAQFALDVHAKRLFLCHVENRTSAPEEKLKEARDVFSDTLLPRDLEEFSL
jgi:ribonuclease Z